MAMVCESNKERVASSDCGSNLINESGGHMAGRLAELYADLNRLSGQVEDYRVRLQLAEAKASEFERVCSGTAAALAALSNAKVRLGERIQGLQKELRIATRQIEHYRTLSGAMRLLGWQIVEGIRRVVRRVLGR